MSRAACILVTASLACAQTPTLTINAGLPSHTIDRRIYGLAIDSRVWGEEVRNRSFEEPAAEGDWKIEGGVLEGASGRFHLGDAKWRDTDTSFSVARTGDAVFTVAVRASTDRGLTISGGPAGLELSRTEHLTRSVLAASPRQLEAGRTYRMRIRTESPRVQFWLDGAMLFDAADPNPAPGHVILSVSAGTARFSGVVVNALDGGLLFSGMPTPARHWALSGAAAAVRELGPGGPAHHHLRISASSPDSGIDQHDLSVRSGDTLRGSLSMQGGGVVVRLLDGTRVLAEQSIEPSPKAWSERPLLLTPRASAEHATLRILARAAATVNLDRVTLMADSARATGGFRSASLKTVTHLHPAILRWYAAHWDEVVLLQEERLEPFGIDEFLAFARAVGAEPVVATPTNSSGLKLAEYCCVPTPKNPGNTRGINLPPTYRASYLEVAESIQLPAIRAAYPSIHLISAKPGAANLVDFLAVPVTSHLVEDLKSQAAEIARTRGSKLTLAVSEWSPQDPIHAALMLNAFERTPFLGLASMQWNSPSAIDAVLQLYSEARAPEVLQLSGAPPDLDAIATRSESGDRIVVKLVNTSAGETTTDLVLRGDFPLLAASVKVLAAGAAQPVEGKVERKGLTARVSVPAGGVALVTLSR